MVYLIDPVAVDFPMNVSEEQRERTINRALLLGFECSRKSFATKVTPMDPTMLGPEEIKEDFRPVGFSWRGNYYGDYNTIFAAALDWLRLNGLYDLVCGELDVEVDNKNDQ